MLINNTVKKLNSTFENKNIYQLGYNLLTFIGKQWIETTKKSAET